MSINPKQTPVACANESKAIRVKAAKCERDGAPPKHPDNGDETLYTNKLGSYSKGLPHDNLGRVKLKAYQTLITALESGKFDDFEKIILGGDVPLINPQAGLAYDLEGTDSHQLVLPPPPTLASEEKAAEAVESYWMALLRDVPFSDYASNSVAQAAAAELNGLPNFKPNLDGSHGPVTTANLFRGFTAGDLNGPYISQFLYQTLEFGAAEVVQRFQTLLSLSAGGTDWLTDFPTWLAVQNGQGPNALAWKTPAGGLNRIDPMRRYVRTGRDISQYVHTDVLFEAYFNACLFLIDNGAPFNAANPYTPSNPAKNSKTQVGFGTFAGPHVKAILAEVATRALKAVWFQKWFVHLHLRPEAYGGLVHNVITGTIKLAELELPDSVLSSQAVARVFSQYGTYLLPHAFPEGCPQHPSYGQGHGTVAGACATIVKAFFDETWSIPDPKVPNANGTDLVSYTGGALYLGDEMNKLAANIALGRDHAAVHWRSDYTHSLILGEALALSILNDQLDTFNEKDKILKTGWSFIGFDGKPKTITGCP